MKDWIKVGASVTLIGLLGANIGMQGTLWLGAPTPGSVKASNQTLQSQHSLKPENAPTSDDAPLILYSPIIVGILTLLVIAYQTFIFRGQAKIADRQADIAEKQLAIAGKQFLLAEDQTNLAARQHELQRQQFFAENRPRVILKMFFSLQGKTSTR